MDADERQEDTEREGEERLVSEVVVHSVVFEKISPYPSSKGIAIATVEARVDAS